jgi:AraC-like DNA-binding protein
MFDSTDGLTFRQDRAVRDYIGAHLAEGIVLDDLAAAAGLSRFHFARSASPGVITHPRRWRCAAGRPARSAAWS